MWIGHAIYKWMVAGNQDYSPFKQKQHHNCTAVQYNCTAILYNCTAVLYNCTAVLYCTVFPGFQGWEDLFTCFPCYSFTVVRQKTFRPRKKSLWNKVQIWRSLSWARCVKPNNRNTWKYSAFYTCMMNNWEIHFDMNA